MNRTDGTGTSGARCVLAHTGTRALTFGRMRAHSGTPADSPAGDAPRDRNQPYSDCTTPRGTLPAPSAVTSEEPDQQPEDDLRQPEEHRQERRQGRRRRAHRGRHGMGDVLAGGVDAGTARGGGDALLQVRVRFDVRIYNA